MNTLFEPSVLFISEEKWKDIEKRDEFLQHLLSHLEKMTDYDITQIYWSDELEEVIWNHPQLPPWRMDRDWSLQIVPVIYELFSKRRRLLDNIENNSRCSISPLLKEVFKEEVHIPFVNLLHFIVRLQEDIYFCVGIENRLSYGKNYIFQSETTHDTLQPLLINDPDDWFQFINAAERLWPRFYNEKELENFRIAINVTAEKESLNELNDNFLYEFRFSENFIKELIKERKYHKEILYSIAKRLKLHQKAASSDNSLNDEPVKGQKVIRRFRVSGSNRIHYRYSDQNNIEFLHYYPEGKHDEGLR